MKGASLPQIIPLAVLIQVIGSFFFAYAAYMQDRVINRQAHRSQRHDFLDFSTLWSVVRSPRWLAGMGLMGLSLVCQITALSMAPVSIVQPVGVLAFPWSMIIQSRAHKVPVGPAARRATIITVAAILGFISIAGVNAAERDPVSTTGVLIGALVAYLLAAGLGVLGSRGAPAWRCLFWASGGAVFYGLEASLVKSLMDFSQDHAWLSAPEVWITIAALVIGSATAGWMVQQGYAVGPAELVVASMTITSPVVAVIFGIAVLGEGQNLNAFSAGAMILLGALAIGGVVLLAMVQPHYADDPDRASRSVAS